MLQRGKLDPVAYNIQDGILYRRVVEGGHSFHAIYIPKSPESLIRSILKAAHDESGHNGFPRTYSAIRRLYYWKGIKEDVLQHCRNCYTCQLHSTAAVEVSKILSGENIIKPDPDIQQPMIQQLRLPLTSVQL